MDGNIAEPLFEIEQQHPELHKLCYKGFEVWTILRFILRINIANKKIEQPGSFKQKRAHLKLLLKILFKSLLFPFKNREVFGKYDVVVFSNQFEKRTINNTVIDKLSSGLIDAYEAMGFKVLVVNYGDSTSGQFKSKHCFNGRLLGEIAWNVYPFFFSKKGAGSIKSVLEKACNIPDAGLIMKELNYYVSLIRMYKILYRLWQPKLVFMPDYSGFSEVFAANQSGIHTIELQHGNINEYHPGYVAYSTVNLEYYSNRMLIFGKNSIINTPGSVYRPEEMLVAGNYYLSKLATEPKSEKILRLVAGYSHALCIPYDITDENFVFDLLSEAAATLTDVAFIFSIRYAVPKKLAELQQQCSNVHIEREIPFQKIVLCCDYNLCSFSTCAIESLSLGKPNILITKDPRTRLYYEGKLDARFSLFIDTVEELHAILQSPLQFDPVDIKLSNEQNIAMDYNENLKRIINILNHEAGLSSYKNSN